MPSPGFEPGSPRPQSKSDDLDRSAMGPALGGPTLNKNKYLTSNDHIAGNCSF